MVRQAPEAASGIAKSAVKNAKLVSADAARRIESEAKAGFETARSIAADTAERLEAEARAGFETARSLASEAAKHADLTDMENRAHKLIDAASDGAAKIVAKVRNGGKAPPPEE